MSNALAKFWPRLCDVPGLQRAAVAHQRLDRVRPLGAGELLALGLPPRRRRAWRARSRRTPCRAPGSCSVSSSASSAVSCAVWPSCQRNSVVRRNSRVTFSQRTTLAHWLMRIGRSRHDCIHFAYIVPMMASEVGRIDQPLLELLGAALRDPRHLRREAFDVLRLLHQQALGDEQREVRVDVAGGLERDRRVPAASAPRWRSRTAGSPCSP